MAIAAQVMRHPRQPDQPGFVTHGGGDPLARVDLADIAGVGGEGRLDQPGDNDDVPLQAFRRMHRENGDGIGAGLQPAQLEAAFLGKGGFEPGNEGTQGRSIRRRCETGGHLGEGIQVRPGGGRRVLGSRHNLNVQPQRPLRLKDQLG